MDGSAEKKEFKLFREKSIEAVESPEALNDYLRVTSPGVWLVLGAVIALLIGGIVWGIFGRITTTASVAVESRQGKIWCYAPYEAADRLLKKGSVSVDGQEYLIGKDLEAELVFISAETDPYIRARGGFQNGDVAVKLELLGTLPEGVYASEAVLESLKPISLLLQ